MEDYLPPYDDTNPILPIDLSIFKDHVSQLFLDILDSVK